MQKLIYILFITSIVLVGCGKRRPPCDEWPPMSFCGDGDDRPTQLLIYTPKQVLIEYTHGDIKEALELARKYCGVNGHYPVKQSHKPETIPGLKEGMKVVLYSCVQKPQAVKKGCGCKKK